MKVPSVVSHLTFLLEGKHRGFAFITYSSSADAQDAIDNMDMNELRGKVLKVNLARPMKTPLQLGGNRAGMSFLNSVARSLFISAKYGSPKSG